VPHKFRFAIQTSRANSAQEWTEKARKIEELGFSTLFIPDHFGDQYAPLIALAAAGAATSQLRLGMLVLDNDFRHPLVLAKELATLDVLTNGRVEAGIGAGWMTTDYEFSGIPYESPGVRIDKLKETLAILKGLWGEGPFSHSGTHYTITNHEGTPKPAQRPHPPLLVGGGGKRVLRLAAREADIVGVNFVLAEGMVNPKVAVTGSAVATSEKIAWIKDAAGARMNDIEMNVTVFFTFVTDDRTAMAERIAGGFGMPASDVLESPHALIGTVDQIVEDLQRRREQYGFSYIAFSGDVFDSIAPVVSRLAGT
jgi:probable F420-dependent oxidoreductase